MSDWLGLGSAMGGCAQHYQARQAMQVQCQMQRMREEQAFMAQYKGRCDVKFERRYGGMVAVTEGGPSVPVVRRCLTNTKS